MVSEGQAANDEVRDALVRENITTSDDASIPGVRVDSAETAEAQAKVIEKHTLEATGGETYSTVDRYIAADGVATTSDREAALLGPDGNPVANPARNTAFQSAALRTSLNMAVMGFKVSELVMGLGAFMIVIGATHILFLAPAVYWAAEVAKDHEKSVRAQAKAAAGATAAQTA
jgi:hypothetical protein